jgi:uroporphyrin-III C-methyltransferase
MTDKEHEALPDVSAEEAPLAADQTTEDADSLAPASARRTGRIWTLLLLIVLIGGVAYWVAFIAQPAHRVTDDRIAGLAADNAKLRAQQAQMEQQLAQVQTFGAQAQAASAALQELGKSQEQLHDAVSGLYAKQTQTSLDWVLAEVEYLIFAASQRLVLERDVATAAAALRSADQRLSAAQHPDVFDLREQLGRDIAALEAVKQPDAEGLAIYLANAVGMVDGLPTRAIADLDMSFSQTSTESVSAENWQGVARALWTDLRSLVEIKDGELEDSVLFDPELRYFLRQNLRLELASARLAILRRDSANFQAAISLAINLLNTYYDTEDGAVSSLISRLDGQLGLQLAPPIPSVSGSLDAVRAKRNTVRETSEAPAAT